ncbi:MAG: Smr/MutS family protein [Treponemataceae bacterium]
MKISKHTLDILQYTDVIKIIAKKCVTDEGKAKLLAERPSYDFNKVSLFKKIGECLLEMEKFLTAPPVKFFPPVLNILQEDKTSLEIEEIYSLGLFTKRVTDLCQWKEKLVDEDKTQMLAENELVKFVEKIPSLIEVQKIIFSLIDEDGNLKSIPSLKKIEKKISIFENEIQKLFNHYFLDESFSGILQSNLPTIKDGRQVLAIKANFKGRIQGIIHEYSQSGQTFYLEPSDVVEKNNDLFKARAEYKAELKRILQKTKQKIFEYKNELLKALELYSKLDVIYAGAKIAKEEKWNFLSSEISAENETAKILLYAARHPLLKNPVPIDLILPDGVRVLIITGPNAGGKTVSLKTLCLFALLNQTGFPVPCDKNSKLPFFDFVACDIGDEQSIDLSLSTFSSHMKNISYILENATSKSLIAIDEFGSGTEPQEGSAIAMAVLDELIEKRPFVFVTSHHGALKNYGFAKDFCENASVEFDNKSLQPSFKIIMGVPGESHAFDIAIKSGLNKKIIDNAKNLLDENKTDISELIKGLIEKNKNAEKLIAQAKEKEQAASEKIRKVDLKELSLKQKEFNLREQGYKRAENFFLEKRRELENIIREIREGELTKEKISNTKDWLNNFEMQLQKESNELQVEKEELAEAFDKDENIKNDFVEGDFVFSAEYNRSGVILRKEKKGLYLVQLGNMKLQIPAEKLRIETKAQPKVSVGLELAKNEKPVFELRLLGMREQEARNALRHQLDLALLSNLKEFSIVHGKGEGILQKMSHEILAENSYVSEFYFALPEDGGTGKTYVKMK